MKRIGVERPTQPSFPENQENLQLFVGDEIKLVDPIAVTDLSAVYSGVHTEPSLAGIPLAVKFSEKTDVLENEYEIGSKFQSDLEIVDYLQVSGRNGMGFVVTEYTSSALEKPAASLSFGDKIRMVRDASFGMFVVHYGGYMHRDIKPPNVFVYGDGEKRACLGDFGLATPIDSDGVANKISYTQRRTMTPGWASPEQYVLEPITAKSDVFSMGLTIAKTLFGKNPFNVALDNNDSYTYDLDNDTEFRRIIKSLRDNENFSYYIDSQRLNGVSSELRATIESCLSINPDDRPDSEELSYVLEREVQRS